MEAVALAIAFALGLAFRQMRLPSLIGYLIAGFALQANGFQSSERLENVAHLGVLLLLFSVGLKLRLLRPILHRVMDFIGHDELFVLYGLLLALVVGGWGFEAINLSPELGALLVGALMAGHPRAVEMSSALWGLKEVFLIGFFLQI